MSAPPPPAAVLVVEDDEAIRDSLLELLEGEGYAVAVARDGAEAFDLLDRGVRPALILLDLMMPGMSGGEFLATIRGSERLRHMPLVVMTAWLNRGPEVTPQADHVLKKPVDIDRLLQLVRQYAGPPARMPPRRRFDSPPRQE